MKARMAGWVLILGAAVGCGGDSSNGSPSASSTMTLAAPAEFRDIASATGDVNLDGFEDLAVLTVPSDPSDPRPAYVSIYYGPLTAGVLPPVAEHYDTAPSASALAVADVDGDGVPDVVIAQRCGAALGRVQVYFRPEQGGVRGEGEAFVGADVVAVDVADVDGDGRADLLASGAGYLWVSRGLGARAFDDPVHVPTSGVWTVRRANGTDVAAARWTDPGVVDVYRWSGSSGLRVVDTVDFGTPVSSLAAADFDGDPFEDLVAGLQSGDSGVVAVALSRGNSSFHAPTSVWTGAVTCIKTGDFDADGRKDLGLSAGTGNGVVTILLGAGVGTFRWGAAINNGAPGLLQKAADLDGDGKSDLIFCSPAAQVRFSPCGTQP